MSGAVGRPRIEKGKLAGRDGFVAHGNTVDSGTRRGLVRSRSEAAFPLEWSASYELSRATQKVLPALFEEPSERLSHLMLLADRSSIELSVSIRTTSCRERRDGLHGAPCGLVTSSDPARAQDVEPRLSHFTTQRGAHYGVVVST